MQHFLGLSLRLEALITFGCIEYRFPIIVVYLCIYRQSSASPDLLRRWEEVRRLLALLLLLSLWTTRHFFFFLILVFALFLFSFFVSLALFPNNSFLFESSSSPCSFFISCCPTNDAASASFFDLVRPASATSASPLPSEDEIPTVDVHLRSKRLTNTSP